jgi:hypothetical protein
MPRARQARAKVPVKGVTWKRPLKISADKYSAVARAILEVLTATPIRLGVLVERVERKLRGFEGSVAWYTITVVRELEARGEVERRTKPVLYSRRRARRLESRVRR